MKNKAIIMSLAAFAVAAAAVTVSAQSLESQLSNRKPVAIETPNFKVKKPATIKATGPLKLVSAKQNSITDDDRWINEHSGGQADGYFADNAPAAIPRSLDGSKLNRVIVDNAGDKVIGLYGYFKEEPLRLIVTDGEMKSVEHYLDLENFKWAPVAVRYAFSNLYGHWARVVDDVLYLAFGHNTYASSSEGMTAYLCAIDLNTYAIKWIAGPTVARGSFDFSYNRIVCGYGFTDEPDYLYLLDKKTGKIMQRVKLRKAPERVVVTGDNVYVRTYSYDYTFRISRGVSGK